MPVADELRVIVKCEVKDAIKNLKSYHKSSQDILKSMQRFAVQAIGVKLSINTIKNAIGGSVQAFLQQQLASEKLSSAIRATGKESQISASQLEALASKLQAVTVFGDETTIAAMSLLQGLANLDQRGLEKVTPAMQDFASAMGVDLEMAASLIGKTLSSTTNALSRYGIQIDTNLPKEEKLAQIVEQIEQKFSGMAETVGKTAYGSLEKFKNAMGDAREWGGKLILHFLQPAVDLLTRMVTKFNEIQQIRDILNNIGKGVYSVEREIETLTGELEKLKRAAAAGGELSGVGLMREIDFRQAQLDALKDTLKWTNAAKRAAKDRDLVAEEAAKKEAERAAQLAKYLKEVAEEYAKTPKGMEEALRAKIQYWESIKRPSAEVVEILALYRKQLEEMTRSADPAAEAIEAIAAYNKELVAAVREAEKAVEEYDQQFVEGEGIVAAYNKELAAARREAEGAIEEYDRLLGEAKTLGEVIKEIAPQMAEAWGAAVADMMHGTASLGDVVKQTIAMILRAIAAAALLPGGAGLKVAIAASALAGAVSSFDRGGVLNEPVYGVGVHSGRRYAFAERGPEEFGGVGKTGRGLTIIQNVYGSVLSEGELLDGIEGELTRRSRGH